MLHLVSSLVVVLIAAGIYFRKAPAIHIRLMTAAFVTDLALVLYIELTRKAVEKVATASRPFLWLHAAISLGVLVCYVVMIVLGRQVLGGQTQSKSTHRSLGIAFVLLRTANYVTALAL